jgi:hypothetical protein
MTRSNPGNADNVTERQLRASTAVDGTLPAELWDVTTADVSLGASPSAADILFPWRTVLQSNSPQCERRSPDYVEGAAAGHFYERTRLDPVIDGATGFDGFVTGSKHGYLEWPAGERTRTLLGRHDTKPADATEQLIQHEGRQKRVLTRPGGSIIEEVRELFLSLPGGDFCGLSFHGAGHTDCRELLTLLMQIRHPRTNLPLPSFATKIHFFTGIRKNALGSWYRVRFQPVGFATFDEYQEAKKLAELVKRGVARGASPE